MEAVCCLHCGADLHLLPSQKFPEDMYFAGGQSKSASYATVDPATITLKEEERWGPFFDSLDAWGIHRKLTLLLCAACGTKLGVFLDDGPAADGGIGQMGFGPSQMRPKVQRYRIWNKSVIRNRPGPATGPGAPAPASIAGKPAALQG